MANWTPEENKALCDAYAKLAVAQYRGEKVNKAALTREHQAGPLAARSRCSIDASWMNCSAAAVDHNLLPGLPFGYVKGYKPAPNRRKGLSAFIVAGLQAEIDAGTIPQAVLALAK